jgi:hypothetical protein
MKHMDTIEIPLSKTKILFAISGSILFILLGLYLFTTLSEQQTSYNPMLAKGAGIAAILFFSATGIYGIRKFFDNTIGLMVDEKGITDNTNASSIGLIHWSDITEIKTGQVMSTRFLLIYTKNPSGILDRAKGMKRKLMAANMKMHGTPLSITSQALKYKFADLEKLLTERLHQYQETASKTS